ncbi:ParB/RepB/Spo0J family partition protein [Clostridium paraputrificum]|uniref:ParB/RepB/Spo0J family partition protein n=1 Tax=Clostridium paraputrificum TaxID=29363 RepID=UPI000668B8C9|nr:ParB/RepB/Spo0J family partition protein [Clostridium paraputrificum]MDB2106644.1 ParB/RepB/Spo0J family partition protein [Clostridium paraputrificum]MDB2113357.1 ParB/RepB/Spo0J family partition protein [Clostridium paraputrificum]
MSKKFSISEGMLNGISKNVKKVTELEAKEGFKLEYIDINKIHRSEKNFYEIIDIDDLAEDIKINGLNHNLVVRPTENGTYELISGERRYTALSKLVNEGNKQFASVPCKIVELNDLDAEIVLIQANAQTRELSESEKLKQVQRLSELYKAKKANGEKVGKIREVIANDLKLSPTQVGRYERINNNLIPELKELLEQGNLSTSNASEFSTLSEESQKGILEILNKNISLSKEEAISLKQELKRVELQKEEEIKTKNSLIRYNSELKTELNKAHTDKSEIISQIEGQLRVEVKQELDDKYSMKIEEVTNEYLKANEEKKKLENEIKELKANAPKENIEEITENIKLKELIKNAESAILAVSRQSRIMEDKKIKFDNSIKSELEHARISSTLFKNLLEYFK